MNLNEAFESYRSAPTEENMELLYPLVRRKVSGVVGKLLKRQDEELIVSITSDVLLDLGNFKGAALFSTWVESAARRDCLDSFRSRDREYPKPAEEKEFVAAENTPWGKRCSVCDARSCKTCVVEDSSRQFQTYAHDGQLDDPTSTLDEGTYLPLGSWDSPHADPHLRDELVAKIKDVLSPDDFAVLSLRIAGHSGDEIAQLVDLTHENIRKKLERIRRQVSQIA